jgi:hypothetical protein
MTLLALTNARIAQHGENKTEQQTAKHVQTHDSSEFNLSSYKQDLNLPSPQYNCVGKCSANPSHKHELTI